MMTRRSGRSFRKLVRRGTNVRESLWGKLTSRQKHLEHGYTNPEDQTNFYSNQGQDLMSSRKLSRGGKIHVNPSEPPPGCPASARRSLELERKDDATFGFEITCNDSPVEELRIVVSCVYPDSPAERAGMAVGDVLVSVNDECVTEFHCQQISDLILNAELIIRLEMVSAVNAKQLELRRKLWQLQCQLKEKTTELYELASREEQLTGGKLGTCLLGESQMSLLRGDDSSSCQSGSSCSRLSMFGSVDTSSLCSALDVLSFAPLSAHALSRGETRRSLTFLDSAHLRPPEALSPLCYPLASGSAAELSTHPPFYRSQSKRRTKQADRNRFTRFFSSSQGCVVEGSIQKDS